jgi:hypothetical protein
MNRGGGATGGRASAGVLGVAIQLRDSDAEGEMDGRGGGFEQKLAKEAKGGREETGEIWTEGRSGVRRRSAEGI